MMNPPASPGSGEHSPGTHCRVVVIGPSGRFLSGISYFTVRLSNALAEKSDIVTAVLFRNMLPKRLFPGWKRVGKDLSSVRLSEQVKRYEIIDWYNPITWIAAASFARRADMVILEWWTASVSHMYFAILCLMGSRRSVAIEFHEVVDPLEQSVGVIRVYARVMGRLIRRLGSRYVVHSAADRALISSQYGIPPDRIAVIHHGLYDQYPVMESQEAKMRIGIGDKYCILFFGLLRPYKGVIHLIEAFESLPDDVRSRAHLLIIGEAWEDQASVMRARQSVYSGQITIVDHYVSDDEISLYFSAADVLVIPYTRASQSGVAHIGMAFGLPIVASRVGGLTESLGMYQGTWFVNPGIPGELVIALEDTYRGRDVRFPPPPELRWERIADQWLQLFASLKQP
jgi:glycosyltransferase involved in cell wall biosynthesis